ncbi:hypothetical protein TESG_07035 [Trichophyton tonsurans CBS 112818]|uniref:Uncharacterized protein n=1 Tax=Trichophyton tonsurans (strain CBS 112818) TaxID=647933 RepID=F2S807_TRIT1|nr:hypothetical protein TESG_07035 [Trichophyton tonsurans CBS 112818]
MPQTTPPRSAESSGNQNVVSLPGAPLTRLHLPTRHSKVDYEYLKMLDSQSLTTYVKAMSEKEREEFCRVLSIPRYKGPSIPYDNSSDIAFEQGKLFATLYSSSDTAISHLTHLP